MPKEGKSAADTFVLEECMGYGYEDWIGFRAIELAHPQTVELQYRKEGKMAIANKKMIIDSTLDRVWQVVTDLQNCSWRSDLDRIEIVEEGRTFIEHTKDGFATTFTITAFEPGKRYEFDMENQNMKGHWIGLFKEVSDGVEIDFTEDVTAKKALMKPFVGAYLKKQQKQYTEDLQRALK